MVEEAESLCTGLCYGCNTEEELYKTVNGLRCKNCSNGGLFETYGPSFFEPEEQSDLGGNLEEFIEELPDIEFEVMLQDGTSFIIDDVQAHAVLMKYGDNWEEFIHSFASKVAEHYEKETEPTKMSAYAPWGSSGHDESKQDYNSHKELAPVVLYPSIRSAMMQLMMTGMAEDKENAPKVVEIGDGKISEYTNSGRVTVEYKEGENNE